MNQFWAILFYQNWYRLILMVLAHHYPPYNLYHHCPPYKLQKFLAFLSYEHEWASKDGIHVIDYRNILRESIFTLCPWGINPESLRLYEAMEAGSIPIFQHLNASISPMTPMGKNNPIPQFENWNDAVDFIDKMRQNFSELEKLQQRIISFYKSYKESIQLMVKVVIDQAFKESHGYNC